ncbi:MAG: glycosyltransferase family 1 protein [Thermacetogeniaceae bacterium]
MSLRIAFFTDACLYQVNGVSRTVERLLGFLEEQGCQTVVFAPNDPVQPAHGLQPRRKAYLYQGIPLPFYAECRLGVPLSPRFYEAFTGFKPDLVHLVTEYSMGLAGLHCACRFGVPVVSSYHTDIARYAAYYRLPFLSEATWRYLVWFHRQCRLNFYPSRSTGQVLAERGIPNLQYWGRGVDTTFFHPCKRDDLLRRRLGPGPLLLYVGRLAPEKDLDVAFTALEQVLRTYPEAKLILAGDGPLGPVIRHQPPAGVLPLGMLQGEELSRLYASCDLFAFPSTTETYGNVVLEAMASGLPVVASLSGGITENLRPGSNGLDFPPHQSQGMAEAILALLDNGTLRRQLSAGARRHAETRSWANALNPVLEGYRSVVVAASRLQQAV